MESKKNLRFAFRQTIPVMLGYIFLGTAFGLMLNDAGYHFLWALLISVAVYAGSMQFVMVTLFTGGASLIYTALMTLFINGRHIFYGLSLIEKFKQMGKSYPYMVFSLTDETYSVLCRTKIPEGLNEKKIMFYISLLNHSYWILGSVLGALAGQMITFNTAGIEFSMTALFTAIVVEQWQEKSNRIPVFIGGISSIIFLAILGPDRFIMPALMLSVAAILFMKKVILREGKYD
ncbi:MAG: AzlC family ABC transporter permease [Lachnospiraceae bacterium]|nr:AzlC family ABC transporter permease [Lachnospiraceae bacterium]